MDIDWLQKLCLSFAHATEQIQWGDNLVFKVGGKIFAIAPLEPAQYCLSFKCSDEDFAELIERPGIVPAPYLARAHWVALESDYLRDMAELEGLLRKAHSLVFAKLPRTFQKKLDQSKARPRRSPRSGRLKPKRPGRRR
ncbi:MAG TPA: MmcQ/YjbR family DNA-binding protein [Candidatus Acidoferrum sp.]|nr:MmcQ/YjbR family DNA-binding protein [Candidatus Acidoferrum sp.]